MRRSVAVICLYLMAVAGFSAGVWWLAYGEVLDQVESRARADLSLASDRLVSQLQRFRDLAVVLSEHPDLQALAEGTQFPWKNPQIDALLLRMADQSGSLDISLLGRRGQLLGGSGGLSGIDHAASSYFQRAMDGALGAADGLLDSGQRVFTYAAPVFSPAGPVLGAVVVSVDLDSIEQSWRGDAQTVFFTNESQVILMSNRSELLLRQRRGGGGDAGQAAGARPFPEFRVSRVQGHDIWAMDAGPYLPRRAMHLELPLPVVGFTAELLRDVAPARLTAALVAAVAGAICLIFGAFLFLLGQRRRALSARLAMEAEANAMLELRVQERTAELSRVNSDLKRAQQELVQAGKLSALGQMSAGISHELNQPLMAIRSFAENAEVLLSRGNVDVARANLWRISDLARRMGRIIKNLRAFSRQESEPLGSVDLVAVIDAVLEISQRRIDAQGVRLDWQRPEAPVHVRGGEVRLQQVVLNLLTNAIDAMEAQAEKRVEIAVRLRDDRVLLHLRDTGPGIDAPEKIFDPFYTTKEVGRSEGMGLGLSISYGLVQSFGGAIRGRNHPSGGAVFTVELQPATAAEQAA
ncbi:sensor histidine kinase [Brevirhabdus sp.]|uniref:sensor histidine kinase n=1 Tax=Brevirhabdus sp. TaxID=2004514 RepID=UPI00405A4756